MKKGFTLVEILVVVLIIGVLAAIALPMYQKAVLKSRFAALMPIGKSIADSNEAYYLEHGQYAAHPQDLPVQGQEDYDDGTSMDLMSNDDYAYTLVYNETKLPDHNYLAFQKHSPKFAGTTMCEARDEEAGKVCLALGGTDLGGGVTENWTAYLLSGDASGSNFCPTGATCDENGNVTECPSGKTPKAGKCAACDIENAVSCSTTEYKATDCSTGYILKAGACVPAPTCGGVTQPAAQTEPCGNGYTSGNKTLSATCVNGSWEYIGNWNTDSCSATQRTAAQVNSLLRSYCLLYGKQCTGIANEDGSVTICDNQWSTATPEGKCAPKSNSSSHLYETVVNPDGTKKQEYTCSMAVSGGGCFDGYINTYNGGTKSGYKKRHCANNATLSNDFTCPNDQYVLQDSWDTYHDSHGYSVATNVCAAINSQGECTAYSMMYRWENTYDGDTRTGSVQYRCDSISSNGTECEAWSQW